MFGVDERINSVNYCMYKELAIFGRQRCIHRAIVPEPGSSEFEIGVEKVKIARYWSNSGRTKPSRL
jgi:hypothetical protein